MDKLTKTYRWNSQGVCENQDTPVSFFKNNIGFYIFTAQAPEGPAFIIRLGKRVK